MTSTAVDTYLMLSSAGDTLLAENDDSNGTRNSRIPFDSGLLFLPAGDYVIEATSFAAGATGAYALSVVSPAVNTFVGSGRVFTSTGLLQAGITISFSSTNGTPPPPVVTDANGRWSQTFNSGASYQATATRSGFDYAPTPSAAFTGPQTARPRPSASARAAWARSRPTTAWPPTARSRSAIATPSRCPPVRPSRR
jgi:hypothetical protein